jgi:hypothetical protein
MSNLNDEMNEVEAGIAGIRSRLAEEIPRLFGFDVVVGNVSYNPNTNSVSVTVEPGSGANEQLSSELGGVRTRTNGAMEFEFDATSAARDD